ncbi:MAG: 30S ribosomal protein S3ae [Thermoplasmata archaeon]|nr:30S ribosomal protein S3ae [Thermoplasmata archaeon]
MAKKSRAATRKVKDKWKSKTWYNIIAPEMFDSRILGETPADSPEKLIDRVTEVTVQDIIGDFSKMHIKLRFKVHDVRGGDAYTYFIGHDMTSDYIRRLTRRKKSRTDGTFDVVTKDDNLVRIKPMAIAERRIQSSKQSAIRKKMGDIVKSEASGKILSELVRAMIMGEMAKKIAVACRSIQPLQRVEIRKSELMRISKLPDIPEKAPEEEPEEPPATEEPEEGEEPAEEVPEESEAAEETPEEAPEEAPEEPEVTEEPAEASEETVEPAEDVEEEEPVES